MRGESVRGEKGNNFVGGRRERKEGRTERKEGRKERKDRRR